MVIYSGRGMEKNKTSATCHVVHSHNSFPFEFRRSGRVTNDHFPGLMCLHPGIWYWPVASEKFPQGSRVRWKLLGPAGAANKYACSILLAWPTSRLALGWRLRCGLGQ